MTWRKTIRRLVTRLFGVLAIFLVGYNTWGPKPQILRYFCWMFLCDLFGMVKTWPLQRLLEVTIKRLRLESAGTKNMLSCWILLKQDWNLRKMLRILLINNSKSSWDPAILLLKESTNCKWCKWVVWVPVVLDMLNHLVADFFREKQHR